MASNGKATTLTPKAIIHQKFSGKALYTVEEVHDSSQNGCPGLAIPQKGCCLYRCRLELPDFSVVSNVCKKKKEAEQSAAEMALEKLGIQPQTDNLTVEDAWNDLVARVKYLFSDEFISSLHPISGHLRAALRRDGDLYGLVPISVLAAFDAKLNARCKMINPKVESNPHLVILYIIKAFAELSNCIVGSSQLLSIRRKNPYPPEIVEASTNQPSDLAESVQIEAIHIPSSSDEAVDPINLNILSSGYYLDVIAEELGLGDASQVLISRTIGKASSETRLYYAAPKLKSLDLSSDLLNSEEELICFEGSLNARASYIYGQDVYGDAILASIGYTWKSQELFYDHVTLQFYHRLYLSMVPSGIYKLSRQAILTADLPSAFTTRTNWRGSFPREILCMFCRQQRLAEPVFSVLTTPLRSLSDLLRSNKKLKVLESAKSEAEYANGDVTAANNQDPVGSGSTFRCEIKVLSKSQDLILECAPGKCYKKQNDSIQNASLKILSWINEYFKDPNVNLEKLTSSANALDIQLYGENFLKEFSTDVRIREHCDENQRGKSLGSSFKNMLFTEGQCIESLISGPDSGVCPSNGTLVSVCYSASLVTNGEFANELIESNEEFEFEMGAGAVVPFLESVVSQMSVGQSACFCTELPSEEWIFAATADSVRTRSLLSSKSCHLEYVVHLLGVKEPPEERMEQALFCPPLSKQRVEYAVKHIKESCSTTLVDFGCGSGSLLDSLLDYPTSLETVAGVDISQKSLARAAKMLHSKVTMRASLGIKAAILYDGSIIDFDSRLHGFDIGTCLEVIEHMEEYQACQFGDIVLSTFQPKILIVSTPNYEYNVILQRSNPESQEDDPEEKTQSQSCKFRNHDHKFEWTRDQFNHWASELATRHNYSVEFSGVGGSGDIEPGFASQIAVFRRLVVEGDDKVEKMNDLVQPYRVIWKWNRNDGPKSGS